MNTYQTASNNVPIVQNPSWGAGPLQDWWVQQRSLCSLPGAHSLSDISGVHDPPSAASPASSPPAPQLGFQSPAAAGVEASSLLLRERWQPFQILHINGGAHVNQMLNMVQQGKGLGFSLPLRGWLTLTLIHNYKTRTRSQVHSFIFKPRATCNENPTPPPPLPSCPVRAFTRWSGSWVL